MPASFTTIWCLLPINDITHSSRLQMQEQRTMWTSNPKHRILSLTTNTRGTRHSFSFVISTRIFFDPQAGVLDGMAEIPWERWGPLNARVFVHNRRCRVGVSGNRVLQAFPATDATAEDHTDNMGYRLHMMDFSPASCRAPARFRKRGDRAIYDNHRIDRDVDDVPALCGGRVG
ncbi:hypothetical protein BDR04DRAFT_303657 [Suillus decipiens]|nr:hypothetical protein BDR04DRAFT_303657 [Suillus decipiens]